MDTIREIGEQSDVIVFPEMTTTGYPPNDLLDNDDFIIEQKEIIYRVRDMVSKMSDNLKVVL
jgi:predicted amidohydrolase